MVRRILRRLIVWGILAVVAWISLYAVVRPPTTHYIWQEHKRLGEIRRQWVPLSDIAPVMARSVVAAEDANFCLHWGFDMAAIRLALSEGANRGASTISQQLVKNVFLWHGRSWARKGLEALMTPMVEAIWSKRRMIEVYLNMVEFDEGVFGVQAASQWYFGVDAKDLSATQAARLAAVLPAPKTRSARNRSPRAQSIADGAATILADGRAACFED